MVAVERTPRAVTIHALNLALAPVKSGDEAIEMIVKCSKGTYIRTLGEDIGEALGCGAHLTRLRRTVTGPFDLSQCITLEALEGMTETQRLACLRSVDVLLDGHATVTLGDGDAGRFLSGMRRRGPWPDGDYVAVYADQPRTLLGTARVRAGELIPVRLLSPVEIDQIRSQPQPFPVLNNAPARPEH